MENRYSQSTPSQYYTPKKYFESGEKRLGFKTQKSTAEKYYDLEESFKKYEQLIEENLFLKQLLVKENLFQKTSPNNNTFSQIPFQEVNADEFKHRKYDRNSSSPFLNSNFHKSQSTEEGSQKESYKTLLPSGDLRMWSLKHRNNFLEQKLQNLQQQYNKQSKMISKVKSSEKWRNRFDCKELTCYQDKYIKLLRVRSPVLLD